MFCDLLVREAPSGILRQEEAKSPRTPATAFVLCGSVQSGVLNFSNE